MHFPVFLWIGPLPLHPHWVFEVLAYLVASRLYLTLRGRGDLLSEADRWTVVTAAMVGAAVGSKLLYWASGPAFMVAHWHDPFVLIGGKSIVGGLLGGLCAVEWAKRRVGITRATGDLFVLPLVVGIAIGRIGCFLTGLDDHTTACPPRSPGAWTSAMGCRATRLSCTRSPSSSCSVLSCLPSSAVPASQKVPSSRHSW
jgi:prolipoprotein diacylglyceryltransferase